MAMVITQPGQLLNFFNFHVADVAAGYLDYANEESISYNFPDHNYVTLNGEFHLSSNGQPTSGMVYETENGEWDITGLSIPLSSFGGWVRTNDNDGLWREILSGDDQIYGGDGNDQILYTAGFDTIDGGGGEANNVFINVPGIETLDDICATLSDTDPGWIDITFPSDGSGALHLHNVQTALVIGSDSTTQQLSLSSLEHNFDNQAANGVGCDEDAGHESGGLENLMLMDDAADEGVGVFDDGLMIGEDGTGSSDYVSFDDEAAIIAPLAV